MNFGMVFFFISLGKIRIILGMKEDDICELLKFERKMLRARIATLKNDKFIQVRLKMETGDMFIIYYFF